MEVTPTPPSPAGIGSRRRARLASGLNAAAALALAAALVVMLNYLSFRHYARRDVSRSHFYSLSDKTRALLASLTNRIDVTVFYQQDNAAYEDVDNLLREYEYAAAGKLRVERVDPDRDLARTEEMARKYQVTEPNVVVFDYAGRSKFVTSREVLEMDYSGVLQGGSPEPKSFKGEQAFSSAIQSVADEKKPKMYLLHGHGERSIEDHNQYSGFSGIAQQIRRDNVDVEELTLGEKQGIPEDADAVVIAGPAKRLSPREIEVLQAYMDRQGRLAVLLDAVSDGGLSTFLRSWGVKVGDDVVVDPTRTLSGLELFVTEYTQHPITRSLREVTSILYLPRSIEPLEEPGDAAGRADKPRVVSLASCSADGWAESDLDQKPMKFDASLDRKGPISLAVAVEKGAVDGVDVGIRPTRMVVFGDTDFAANGALTGGNVDLMLGALNWLIEREHLLAIAPKTIDETRLVMSRAQLNLLGWTVIAGLPSCIALAGGLVWLRRRA